MRKKRLWIPLGLCAAAVALLAVAQAGRRPGLWEVNTTMTWQQSPMPPGMQLPPGSNSPFAGGVRTTQVCVTQEMLDKFGGPAPQSRGDCQLSGMVKNASSMTATIACTGQMNGKGTVEASWTEDGHSTSKFHFTGTMQMGPRSAPVEFTSDSSSAFKGPDCGSVKPLPMPK